MLYYIYIYITYTISTLHSRRDKREINQKAITCMCVLVSVDRSNSVYIHICTIDTLYMYCIISRIYIYIL